MQNSFTTLKMPCVLPAHLGVQLFLRYANVNKSGGSRDQV